MKLNEETEEEQEIQVEYPFDPKSSACPTVIQNVKGVCAIKDLVYEKSETFDEGCYVIEVTDITKSNAPLQGIKIALMISS